MRGTGGPHTLPGMGTDVKQRLCGSSRRRMFVGTTVAGSEEAAAPFPAEIALVWALLAVVAVPVALMAIPIAVLVGERLGSVPAGIAASIATAPLLALALGI